jgi:ABC-type branched-subunit amino acid transport system permease subunit
VYFFRWEHRVALILAGGALLLTTLELIRKRRLREEYSVLWILTAVGVLVSGIYPTVLEWVAMRITLHPAVLMTFLCVLFLMAILLHYSVVISKHSEREKGLAQEAALLKDEIARLREEVKEARKAPPEPKPRPPALRT